MKRLLVVSAFLVVSANAALAQMGRGEGGQMVDHGWGGGWGMGYGGAFWIVVLIIVVGGILFAVKRNRK